MRDYISFTLTHSIHPWAPPSLTDARHIALILVSMKWSEFVLFASLTPPLPPAAETHHLWLTYCKITPQTHKLESVLYKAKNRQCLMTGINKRKYRESYKFICTVSTVSEWDNSPWFTFYPIAFYQIKKSALQLVLLHHHSNVSEIYCCTELLLSQILTDISPCHGHMNKHGRASNPNTQDQEFIRYYGCHL